MYLSCSLSAEHGIKDKGGIWTKMEISKKRYQEICQVFRYTTYEKGGVLGIFQGKILSYYLDKRGSANCNSYYPDGESLSLVMQEMRKTCDEIAFVHSHPEGWERLSYADLSFARQYLVLNKRESVYMALVTGEKMVLYHVMMSQENAMEESLIFRES